MHENKRTSISFFERNVFFLSLFGIMLGGILIGSLAFCSMNENSIGHISFVAQGFINTRVNQGAFDIFINSLLSSSAPILLLFILGFSAITQVVEFMIPFFRGLGLGASIAQIYALAGAKGFFIVLLLILPYAILSFFGMLIAAREAIRFSNTLAHSAFNSKSDNGMKNRTRLYILRFLVIEVVMVLSAIIDCLCSFLFANILLN